MSIWGNRDFFCVIVGVAKGMEGGGEVVAGILLFGAVVWEVGGGTCRSVMIIYSTFAKPIRRSNTQICKIMPQGLSSLVLVIFPSFNAVEKGGKCHPKNLYGTHSQSSNCAAIIIRKRYEACTCGKKRNAIRYERIKPTPISIIASIKKRCLVFDLMFVPESQWGKRSAAMWETIARGMAMIGLANCAAITVPITACPVAVISPV